jgi:putative endonuclease
MIKEYWVYILKCADESYYTGKTSNLNKRLHEHTIGVYKGYTYLRRPVKLLYSQKFYSEREANEAERRIKKWSRKKKEALIIGDFKLLHDLSVCKNQSHYTNKY